MQHPVILTKIVTQRNVAHLAIALLKTFVKLAGKNIGIIVSMVLNVQVKFVRSAMLLILYG